MYYIANFSVISRDGGIGDTEGNKTDMLQQVMTDENSKQNSESVFCQADLWNLQKQMRTIHVTDRFPRTWEGIW